MTGAPLAPGYRIGDYELVHQLGRGAIGETFKARVIGGRGAGQLVCLKVLAQEFRDIRSAERDAAVRYLRHEARVVAQLDHPNIARLLDSGVSDEVWYLAFELVDGANLGDVLAHGALGAYHVMHLGLELSKALACAHERDVLHRDIKPNNILIGTGGDVKLVDFGLAKLNAGAASQFSQHVGTPRYFSPEQVRGDALTPATDIYAVGLVLFELLTGSHPFYDADIDVFRRNLLQGLPQRSLRGRNIPRDLVSIVERCIELDRSKRFANANALHNALRAAVDQCSRTGGSDLRELSALRAGDAGPDSQAETRFGDIADRVADIRDESDDVRTQITADPTEAYRAITRVVAPAETAAEAARAMSFQSESIMGDLSRLARAVAEQRSSGLEPAQPNRSGVRPADEATPLRRSRTPTKPNEQSPLGTSELPTDENAPTVVQGAPDQAHTAVRVYRRWTRRSSLAALCLLLVGIGAAVVALRSSSESRVPDARSTAPTVVSATPGTSRARPVSEAPSAPVPAAQHPAASKAATRQDVTADAVPNTEGAGTPASQLAPVKTQPQARRTNSPRKETGELVNVTIGTIPYGEVTVDGRRVGTAPVVVKLAPGPHRIVGRSQQLRRVQTIVVSPEMNQIVLDLRSAHASP